MTDLIIRPATRPLQGVVPVPSDKSISHRALMLGALSTGRSSVVATLGDDNRSTAAALRSIGIVVEQASRNELVIHGAGLDGLSAPVQAIDCGNSGTTMRLLCGILVAQRFASRLIGDTSLSRRPMGRVAKPLRLRGANIEGHIDPKRPGEIHPPIEIGALLEARMLSGIEYEMPMASAQVKSALLLSGLFADGPTYVHEPHLSRDHTERMLAALGVPVRTIGPMVEVDPTSWSRQLPAFDLTVPGDLSSAAFLIAAAQLVAGSEVGVRNVGLNPTRTGFFDALRDMGGVYQAEAKGEVLGEPVGDIFARSAHLRGFQLGGEGVARSIDELPILMALAARARGVTRIVDASELRVKETDRISAMVMTLRGFGIACEEAPDGIAIEGKPEGPLDAAVVDSRGDHRVAMTASVLGLIASGPVRILDVDCIQTSFPRFVGTMRALGGDIDVVEGKS